jgi:protein-tyrosine phosphatase
MAGFVIHALHVGGGTLALAPLPGDGGDYAADMAHLADWKPALVISMTTEAEMVAADWARASAAARAALAGGGRVLVHCRGGCGRSGMAVLRLMIETGEAPEAALARLRARRACAVETAAQLAWALR